MRVFFLVLFVVSVAFGQIGNWGGYGDTSAVTGLRADSTKYSKVFQLSQFEDVACVLKCDDTSSSGFASDSLAIAYGYQLGYPVYDSGGSRDTLWWLLVTLDTVVTDSLGTKNTGSVDSDGALTDYLGQVDTTSVTGYACQASWYVPEWAPIIRYWATGLSGTSIGNDIVAIFDHKKRVQVKTNSR